MADTTGIFGNYAQQGRNPLAPRSAGLNANDLGKKKKLNALAAILGAGNVRDPFSPGATMMPGSGGIAAADYFDQMRMNPMNSYF